MSAPFALVGASIAEARSPAGSRSGAVLSAVRVSQIDARLVLQAEILSQINTAIARKKPGIIDAEPGARCGREFRRSMPSDQRAHQCPACRREAHHGRIDEPGADLADQWQRSAPVARSANRKC